METIEITGKDYAARISYTVTQNTEQNRSEVKVEKVELKALSAGGFSAYIKGSITIDGKKAAAMAMTESKYCKVALSTEYAGGGEGSWSGFSSNGVTVNHQDDGTAIAQMKVNLAVHIKAGTQYIQVGSAISKTVDVEIKRIPKTSRIQALAVDLGQEMTIKIIRKSASFRDTLAWRCGYQNGTIAEKTGETELRWMVPMELANEEPYGNGVGIFLIITTYDGNTEIGTNIITRVCGIPASIHPTMSFTVTDRNGYLETCGGYVQGQSQALVTVNAEGCYGSTISSIEVWCGRMTGKGNALCFALEESGTVVVSVKVTDSRGRTAGGLEEITVLPYVKPTILITDCYRCDEAGNEQPDGEWAKLVFDANVMEIKGNTVEYIGNYIEHNTTNLKEVEIKEYSGQFKVIGGSFIARASIDAAYDCYISAVDRFCAVDSDTVLLAVAFALLDLCRDTKAIGIGMRAKNESRVSFGLDANMEEHRIENMAEPEMDTDAATKKYVDDCIRRLKNELGI